LLSFWADLPLSFDAVLDKATGYGDLAPFTFLAGGSGAGVGLAAFLPLPFVG